MFTKCIQGDDGMVSKKVDTKDWKNLTIDKWNGTTFREYIKFLNLTKFGVAPVTNSIMVENAQIKTFTKEYGKEVTKRFIEACVNEYQGNNPKYPTVNFMFMNRYMKERNLPAILGEVAKADKLQKLRKELKEEQNDVEDYF